MQNLSIDGFSVRFIIPLGLLALMIAISSCTKKKEEPVETLPMKQLSLDNLEDFRSAENNWSIAGGVQSNRQVDLDLTALEGTGILVNMPSEESGAHLFTGWKHGDLEIELDFLMPKGSNSGIYLMGRYEVQLFDSWGVDQPNYSDVGGIYNRRDESRPEGDKEFEGSAPKLNAARAPGLWQHLKILFTAPEFDESGNKISNARFEEVWLNGSLIQENVEVSGPTIEAYFEDEQEEGPLMIQGDHGPVAFRNIKYKRYDKKMIGLKDLRYGYYPGEFETYPDFNSLEAGETGSPDSLAGNVVNRDDRYALLYRGVLETPNSGTYLFKLQNAGMVRMFIDDDVIFDQDRPFRMHELETKTIELESGQQDFRLEYINHPNNWYRGLSLFAEGPKLRLQKLHASSSVPGGGRRLPDLFVEAGERVKVLRSFAMHKESKRTHVVNVGAPDGINFSYDLGQSSLLHAWEGPFLNTNEMWINRGEPQTAAPAGPPVTFDGKPSFARLNGKNSWPDSVDINQLQLKGYSISDSGWPVFRYSYEDIKIEDRFEGSAENRRLVRTVTVNSPEHRNDFWFQLASGKEILLTGDEYVVDDRTFYLKIIDNGGLEPEIVRNDKLYDLRIPLLENSTEAVFKYEIIW